MQNAALRGDLTEQYSAQFAVVTLEGRILYGLGRVALRAAEPDFRLRHELSHAMGPVDG